MILSNLKFLRTSFDESSEESWHTLRRCEGVEYLRYLVAVRVDLEQGLAVAALDLVAQERPDSNCYADVRRHFL